MKKRRVKRRIKKWVKITVFILISLVILISITIFINNYFKKQNDLLLDKKIPIETLKKAFHNDDIRARLVIKDIGLDAVITKSTNNVYYLKYNAYKKPSKYGNPFLDYRNHNNLDSEKQINIYGHNIYDELSSKNQPFAKLENYLDYNTFEKDNRIMLYTDKETLMFKVYAVKIITESEREHMIINDLNEEQWIQHYENLLSNTKYCKDECKLDKEDNILVLQTCHFDPKNSYILVIAKKMN